MNLLGHTHLRDYRPRCGSIIPGTLQLQTVPPAWSPPRLQLFETDHPGQLMEWIDGLFACNDVHVCAVSPAAVCALRESDSINIPLLTHYTITVLYQERLTPAAFAPTAVSDTVA